MARYIDKQQIIYIYIYIYIHTYIHTHFSTRRPWPQPLRPECGRGAVAGPAGAHIYIYIYIYTVGFHNFNLRIFNLRVSNLNKLIVDVLTRCRISMCQGLGPKKHNEISEIDRIYIYICMNGPDSSVVRGYGLGGGGPEFNPHHVKLSGLQVRPFKVSGGSPVLLRSEHRATGSRPWKEDLLGQNNIYIYIYICIYVRTCMYVCIYIYIERERERWIDRQTDSQTDRQTDR